MKYLKNVLIFVMCTLMLLSCGPQGAPEIDIAELSTKELIQILEDQKSNNDSNLFLSVVEELERRGQTASTAAPALAQAIAYDRRDSTMATRALIAIGPAAKIAIPDLLKNLNNQRADVRLYTVFELGIIGESSLCAIPKIAPLLWDSDSEVRSAAASALDAIVGEDLVESTQELDPSLPGSVFLDKPEGNISGKAREWWLSVGKGTQWPVEGCEISTQ